MSLQIIWNFLTGKTEWEDLSYITGKTDTPDPKHGQPVLIEGICPDFIIESGTVEESHDVLGSPRPDADVC